MASLQPIVLEVKTTRDFVEQLLDNHAHPSTLIVCSSKAEFVRQMLQHHDALESAPPPGDGCDPPLGVRKGFTPAPFAATLRLLSTSRTITVAFCHDYSQLRAYLATYSTRLSQREAGHTTGLSTSRSLPILAIINLIEVHRNTNAFSAQGFNRSIALAVESANRAGSKLVMAQSPSQFARNECDVDQQASPTQTLSIAPDGDPWSETVSMLNVTTKTFGAGEIGWSGRTVTLRRIAERWCTFLPAAKEEGHSPPW